MLRKSTIQILRGAFVGTMLVASGSAVQGDITKRKNHSAERTSTQLHATRLATDTPLRVECWQHGRKIIDQNTLYGFSVNSILEQASVSFRRGVRGNPSVFIVSLKHSTCLIHKASSGK